MFKTLFILLFVVSTTSIFASPSEEKNTIPLPANFDVNLKLTNFSQEQEEKILKAADLIKKVIMTEEFRSGVLNHTYQGQKTYADNNGLTNEQIYQKILEGSEELHPGVDSKMDLELQVYFEETRTVGYTRPTVTRIWMNSKYLNKNGPAEVTTNMMHEWLHKLGFKHDIKHSRKRMNTVPYAIGYLMERLAQKIYSDGSLQ